MKPKSKPQSIIGLSKQQYPKEFDKELNYLVATSVFNNDSPHRAKGLRAHAKRLLESWEKERNQGVLFKGLTSIHTLKMSLKNSRGMFLIF